MDAACDPEVSTVVFMKSAQVGSTADRRQHHRLPHPPGSESPILVVQPNIKMVNSWSKSRLAPMLRDTPVLRGKVRRPPGEGLLGGTRSRRRSSRAGSWPWPRRTAPRTWPPGPSGSSCSTRWTSIPRPSRRRGTRSSLGRCAPRRSGTQRPTRTTNLKRPSMKYSSRIGARHWDKWEQRGLVIACRVREVPAAHLGAGQVVQRMSAAILSMCITSARFAEGALRIMELGVPDGF